MSNVVWTVNILLGIGMLGVSWILYYILTLDNREDVYLQDQENQKDS